MAALSGGTTPVNDGANRRAHLTRRRHPRIHAIKLHSDVLHSRRMEEAHNRARHGSAPGTTPNRIQGNPRVTRMQNAAPSRNPASAGNGVQGC